RVNHCEAWYKMIADLGHSRIPSQAAFCRRTRINLPLIRPDRAPPEGAEANEIDIRPMCAVQDSFKHWTAARRRIDYPIRECPVWRTATGGSGSMADAKYVPDRRSNPDLRINRSASPSERAVRRRRARFYATARQRRPGRVWEIGWGHGAICGRYASEPPRRRC